MEEYLDKRIYIYRKSYNLYQKISISLSISKFILSASGLSAFVLIPLAALSLSAGIVEVIEKSINILEKKEEYKQCYIFYKQLQNLFKSSSISEDEIYTKEKDFINNLKYFPVEKYVKQTQLNGYKYISSK